MFDRLGAAMAESAPTPLRLAELDASQARLREIEARQAGVTLTTFHLVVRDVDIRTFAWEAWFEPTPDPESTASMSVSEYLGSMLVLHMRELLEKGMARACEQPADAGG